MRRCCALAAACLFTASALAETTGKAEAGLVLASGNTETETTNFKLQLLNERDSWQHKLGAAYLYASNDIEKTADRWELAGESDYRFGRKTFWFGAARYEQDQFSGFEYQATLSSGLGSQFIDTERTKFSGTAGVGYKFVETRPAFDDAGLLITPGDRTSETIYRSTLDFETQLTATTQLLDRFIVEVGADNTFAQNDISVQVKITDVLALAAGYSVRRNSDPPSGFRKTDTLTTLNLVYELR